jgi:hypothetical protein
MEEILITRFSLNGEAAIPGLAKNHTQAYKYPT